MTKNSSFPFDAEIRKILEKSIDNLCLLDDILFRACLKDNPKAAEAIIRVALEMPDAEVESLSIQDESAFPNNRNVRFDLKVKGRDGKLFDVEVQKGNVNDLPFRSRFYFSALSVESLKPGDEFMNMPPVYVLFICEKDPFGKGKPYYSYELADLSECEPLHDRGYIRFLNCTYRGDDPYGKLSEDMTSTGYEHMHNPVLRDTLQRGKIGKRRLDIMSDLSKEILELGRKKGMEEGTEQTQKLIALNLLKMGRLAPEDIASCTGLPLETVLSLK